MAYRVLKPIPNGDGTYHQTGDLVQADGWRNLRALVNGRYLVEVVDAAVDEPAEPKKSRAKRVASDDAE